MVKVGVAWPRRSLTTLTGTPEAMSSVTWVWRRSWSRMTRHAGSLGDALKGLGDGVRMDHLTVAVGEHPSRWIDADGSLFGVLPVRATR